MRADRAARLHVGACDSGGWRSALVRRMAPKGFKRRQTLKSNSSLPTVKAARAEARARQVDSLAALAGTERDGSMENGALARFARFARRRAIRICSR